MYDVWEYIMVSNWSVKNMLLFYIYLVYIYIYIYICYKYDNLLLILLNILLHNIVNIIILRYHLLLCIVLFYIFFVGFC